MDNLTHSLVGASLGQTGLSNKVPGGTFSLIVAANLPDLDVVSSFWGNLYYLAYHRGTSHSIVGTLGLAVILTGVLWLIGRARGHPASLGQISLAVFAATATHPLLDFTNSYGLRPFLPFLDRWYYGDLVFIIDPYIWLLLGAAVFLTGRQKRPGMVAWLVGATVASAVLVASAVALGLWVPLAIWLTGVGTVLFLKTRKLVLPASAAAGALGAIVLYWGFLAVIHSITLKEVYADAQALYPGISREAVSATPRPANPFEWDLFVEMPGHVAYARASSFLGDNPGFERIPSNRDHPAATAAASTCPGVVFTHFARFPVFDVSQAENGSVVTIEDVRFSRRGGTRGFGTVTIRLDSPGEVPCPEKSTRPRSAPQLQTNKSIGE